MNEIFASTPIYRLHMNNGFDGSPKSLFSTGAFTAYPGSSWAARLAGGGSPKTESVLELGYRVQLTEFAYAMPEFQYIIRPGGTGDLEDALVWGLRIGLTF